MSTSELVTSRIIKETSWGVVPASAMQNINVRTGGLRMNPANQRPNVRRGDYRRFKSRRLSNDGALQLAAPIQYQNLSHCWAGFLGAEPASVVTLTAATISFNSGTKVIADSGNGLAVFLVGDVVYVSGAANAGNNGAKGLVTASAAGSITVQTSLTTEAAGASVTISTIRQKDSTGLFSYAYEDDYGDLTTTLRGAKGLSIGDMGMTWSVGEFAEETFNLIGDTPAMMNATYGTGAPTAAKTSDFMNSLATDVIHIFEGGSSSSLLISQLSVSGSRNSALRRAIKQGTGPIGVSLHAMDVEVTMNMYMDAAARTLIEKAEAGTATSLWWTTTDPQGNFITYSLPAVSSDDGNPLVGEPGNDNMAEVKLAAYMPTTTYDYQFARFMKTAA